MDCCSHTPSTQGSSTLICPVCEQKGKSVKLITLKALLKPSALETINPESPYTFCSNPSCKIVYFSDRQTYSKDALKVSVFQKDKELNVPVCYCFGWTRERLIQAIEENQRPSDHIREQMQANRCGCEINNPQGACCLGNVTTFVRGID
ncbi:(2Fe-2S)-binding protein [Paenibacillus sp. D2_2]|uniref:putative iron-sulfur cluster-binding metallochaperone n=1 Tax=Paenibacillus sp. D2_2 TaxID=3073092 RepID=UPI002816142D|nr:(2Fe-2S)-binding protein [Paenibacillus sp. D2_2]WMT39853.1 (2Fe-2S)-binding protein [Paenibacillus sp. D2_2]